VLGARSKRIILQLTIQKEAYRDPTGQRSRDQQALAGVAKGVSPPTIGSCDKHRKQTVKVAGRTVIANAERPRRSRLGRVGAETRPVSELMVDRITPATTWRSRAEVRRDFGVNDRWPVVADIQRWVSKRLR